MFAHFLYDQSLKCISCFIDRKKDLLSLGAVIPEEGIMPLNYPKFIHNDSYYKSFQSFSLYTYYDIIWLPLQTFFDHAFRYVNRVSRDKTLIFHSITSWFTTLVLRLLLGLWFELQSYPSNRLIKFLYVGSRTLLHYFLHPYHYWYQLVVHYTWR